MRKSIGLAVLLAMAGVLSASAQQRTFTPLVLGTNYVATVTTSTNATSTLALSAAPSGYAYQSIKIVPAAAVCISYGSAATTNHPTIDSTNTFSWTSPSQPLGPYMTGAIYLRTATGSLTTSTAITAWLVPVP